jgi:hypothetical protein
LILRPVKIDIFCRRELWDRGSWRYLHLPFQYDNPKSHELHKLMEQGELMPGIDELEVIHKV